MPAIISLKCNELPTIFPPHFLLQHSNGASMISRCRRCCRLTLCCVCSPSCLSEYYESPPFPPTSISTTQASCVSSLGACEGARECLSFPLSAVWGADRISAPKAERARAIKLPASPQPRMSNVAALAAVFDGCTSAPWAGQGSALS